MANFYSVTNIVYDCKFERSAHYRMPIYICYKGVIHLSLHTEIASDGLKGRVFEASLADLQNDEVAFRKFKLICEDVQGKNCLTNFHGMDMTTDKLRSLVKKWQVSCWVSNFHLAMPLVCL